MAGDALTAPTLFDLLARHWTLPGPLRAVCFNFDETAVAFAIDDGLALATMTDPERPETRTRIAADDGRRTIRPRERPVRPVIPVAGARAPLVPFGARAFLAAGTEGGLVQVTARGQALPSRLDIGGPVTAMARDPASRTVAVAAGERVLLLDADDPNAARTIEVGEPVTALAYAPDGQRLAIGHAHGVSFATDDALGAGVALDHPPRVLSFGRDGARLACGFETPGFALLDPQALDGELVADFPTAVSSFAWTAGGGALAASGAFRIVAWALDEDGDPGDALLAGRGGLVVVERVAAHPTRPLVAAGYENGLVAVAQVGAVDEMVLRDAGAPIMALAWSADGRHLALGDTAGCAAIASFPPDLFK